MGSTLVTDEKLQFVLENMAPCTLPPEAYGPQPIEWTPKRTPVWAWISWPHKAAERLPAWVMGANDRVVIVAWDTSRGERNTVVWRSAVTRRQSAGGQGAPGSDSHAMPSSSPSSPAMSP